MLNEKEYFREYARKNKVRINAYNIRYRKENALETMYIVAKGRAKKFGIEFTITIFDLPVHMPSMCPWLGIPLVLASGKWTDNSPSLDRIDNQLGYVPGNTIIVSSRANRLKSDATAEELIKIGRALLRLKRSAE